MSWELQREDSPTRFWKSGCIESSVTGKAGWKNGRSIGYCRIDLFLGQVGDIGKIRALKFCALQIGVFKVGHPEIGTLEICQPQVRTHKIRDAEMGAFEIR